ncbi:MAG: hypothetical protein RSE07_01925 [Oscillospiraceae bacterium]
MINTINAILKIDEKAKQKVNEALKFKDDVEKQMQKEMCLENEEIDTKINDRIKKIEDFENQYSAEQAAIIDKQTKDKIQNLEDVYNKIHEKLEEEIFQNIVGQGDMQC